MAIHHVDATEDEEVLVHFASQAAAAVANAHTYRNEQHARADLEALVETSPVGVVVFDATSGRPVSFNREARRIVETLRKLGRPPEELLEIVSFRRADGREASLSELSLAQWLGTGALRCAPRRSCSRSPPGAASGR